MPAELLTSCRFYFEANDIQEKQIQEVSGLSVETTATADVYGSTKGAKSLRQVTPTVSKFTTVTIKVIATTDLDLYKWYEACCKNDGGANQWESNRKEASVTAYDQSGQMKARWEIVDAIATKYEGPSFKAADTGMATETITLTHQGIKRMQ